MRPRAGLRPFAICLFASVLACQSSEHFRIKRNQSGSWKVTKFHLLPTETPPGLSGLSRVSEEQLVSVAERNNVLLQILSSTRSETLQIKSVGIPEIPQGLDLEAIAILTSTSAWIGTEAKTPYRASDTLFKVSLQGAKAKVTEELQMPYAQFSRMPKTLNRSNRGIEGVCVSNDKLIVATELPYTLDNQRLAAFSAYSFASQTWVPFYVSLLSKTGKISGISCVNNMNDNQQVLFAIERHYGVAQIIKITVPRKLKKEQTLQAERIVDLSLLFDKIPNLEGIVAHSDDSVTLISDNQSASVNGRAVLLTLNRIE